MVSEYSFGSWSKSTVAVAASASASASTAVVVHINFLIYSLSILSVIIHCIIIFVHYVLRNFDLN